MLKFWNRQTDRTYNYGPDLWMQGHKSMHTQYTIAMYSRQFFRTKHGIYLQHFVPIREEMPHVYAYREGSAFCCFSPWPTMLSLTLPLLGHTDGTSGHSKMNKQTVDIENAQIDSQIAKDKTLPKGEMDRVCCFHGDVMSLTSGISVNM